MGPWGIWCRTCPGGRAPGAVLCSAGPGPRPQQELEAGRADAASSAARARPLQASHLVPGELPRRGLRKTRVLSTSPFHLVTHWKQALLYLKEPRASGARYRHFRREKLLPSRDSHRLLHVQLCYKVGTRRKRPKTLPWRTERHLFSLLPPEAARPAWLRRGGAAGEREIPPAK